MWADKLYGPVGPWLANGLIGSILGTWSMVSVVVLPLFVVFEVFSMRDFKIERRSLLIDAAFVAVWLVAFFAVLLFALTHYAPI